MINLYAMHCTWTACHVQPQCFWDKGRCLVHNEQRRANKGPGFVTAGRHCSTAGEVVIQSLYPSVTADEGTFVS